MCKIILVWDRCGYILKNNVFHGVRRVAHDDSWGKKGVFNHNIPNSDILEGGTSLCGA